MRQVYLEKFQFDMPKNSNFTSQQLTRPCTDCAWKLFKMFFPKTENFQKKYNPIFAGYRAFSLFDTNINTKYIIMSKYKHISYQQFIFWDFLGTFLTAMQPIILFFPKLNIIFIWAVI